MTILLLGIFVLNWDFKDFGTYTYWIKQSLTGVLIRLLIIFFPFSGPAINPMLATTYDAHVNGTFSDSYDHYVVYWLSSFAGAFVASLCYALWRVDTKFLGKSLRGDLRSIRRVGVVQNQLLLLVPGTPGVKQSRRIYRLVKFV